MGGGGGADFNYQTMQNGMSAGKILDAEYAEGKGEGGDGVKVREGMGCRLGRGGGQDKKDILE